MTRRKCGQRHKLRKYSNRFTSIAEMSARTVDLTSHLTTAYLFGRLPNRKTSRVQWLSSPHIVQQDMYLDSVSVSTEEWKAG